MSYTRRMAMALACAVGMTAMIAGLAGPAQAWEPNKPIDFVIMAGPGGGADQMARFLQAIAEKNQLISRPLVPNNKGGGSGAEALLALNSAADPDHTILVTLNSFFTTPLRQPNLGVDIMQFTPVGRMAEDTFILWVHKDAGITTFEQFLEAAKAAGNKWVMGGTGKAQEDEMITAYLNSTFGLDIKYIPYKGGGEVAKELAGKQVNSTVNNPSEARGFYESGDVVPLVVFTPERLPNFPDVPTLKEKGQDFSYYMQRAVVGAKGMSPEAAAYYQEVFKKLYDTQEWQDYMKKQSLVGTWLGPEETLVYWKEQRDRHEIILKAMGAM